MSGRPEALVAQANQFFHEHASCDTTIDLSKSDGSFLGPPGRWRRMLHLPVNAATEELPPAS